MRVSYKQDAHRALERMFFALCKGVNSPVSLGSWLRFKYGELDQLVRKKINPNDYISADEFFYDFCCVEYLTKYEAFNIPGVDKEAVALRALATRESRNLSLNRYWYQSMLISGQELEINRVRLRIERILGPFRPKQAILGNRFGPGSTVQMSLLDAYRKNKYLRGITVTRAAHCFFKSELSNDIHWLRARGIDADGPVCLTDTSEFVFVEAGELCTVPKKSTTDRTILKEPLGNLFLQFGVGKLIRNALKRVKINLDSQQENRYLAAQGWATIDLSNASNSVFIDLVKRVLPHDWFDYLNRIRTPAGLMPTGELVRFEMFSSMGNGFTFELESLIFYAIAKEACLRNCDVVDCETGRQHGIPSDGPFCYYSPRDALQVFGDDIVCHPLSAGSVVRSLESFGFETNGDKTFVRGPYRESCGFHSFHGMDVTPIYQKRAPTGRFETYRAINRSIRLACRFFPGFRDKTLKPMVEAACSLIDIKHATWDPSRDSGVVCFFGDSHSKYLGRSWTFVPDAVPTSPDVDYAYTLRFGTSPVIGAVPLSEWRLLCLTQQGSSRGVCRTTRDSFQAPVSDAPWI